MEQCQHELCECCGIRTATDGHHCLISRSKKHPCLNHPYNIERVCRVCHSGVAKTYEHKCQFFARQKARHGQAFLDWWDGLPMKVKPRYE